MELSVGAVRPLEVVMRLSNNSLFIMIFAERLYLLRSDDYQQRFHKIKYASPIEFLCTIPVISKLIGQFLNQVLHYLHLSVAACESGNNHRCCASCLYKNSSFAQTKLPWKSMFNLPFNLNLPVDPALYEEAARQERDLFHKKIRWGT